MFNPKYRVLLMSKCFPRDKVVCLGTQLISIIDSIKGFLPQHIWYGADIEAVGKGAKKYNLQNIQPNVIGNDLEFIKYCSEIEQFIWGVFFCIDNDLFPQDIQNIELETEDKSFRPIACEGVLIEIRTFDTTYFGIYSDDIELMNKLSGIYNIEIEENKNL